MLPTKILAATYGSEEVTYATGTAADIARRTGSGHGCLKARPAGERLQQRRQARPPYRPGGTRCGVKAKMVALTSLVVHHGGDGS